MFMLQKLENDIYLTIAKEKLTNTAINIFLYNIYAALRSQRQVIYNYCDLLYIFNILVQTCLVACWTPHGTSFWRKR